MSYLYVDCWQFHANIFWETFQNMIYSSLKIQSEKSQLSLKKFV